MSRNYFSPIITAFNANEAARQIEFQAGSNNQGVLSVEVPGRGAPGYGQAWANTITKLLSHNAAHTKPANPIVGELWFDRTAHRLQMFVGVTTVDGKATNGWMYLPASYSATQKDMLSELGAINKAGDTAAFLTLTSYLQVEGAATFCGASAFHEDVVFKGAHTHQKQNGQGSTVHASPGSRVTFEAAVTYGSGATIDAGGDAVFKKKLTVNNTGSLTVAGPTNLTGATTISGATTMSGSIEMSSKDIKSKGKILIDNIASDVSVLEIGVNGELIVKGKLTIVGEMVSNSSTRVSVGSITPVASGTPPSMSKTFTRIVAGPANNTGKVRFPSDVDVGLHMMVANDSTYDVTIERPRTTDTVNGVAENIVIGAGARMQFVVWATTTTKTDWALMNSFYG